MCVVVDIPFEMGRKLLQRPNDKFIIHERGWVENPRSLCVLVTHKNSFDCLTPFSLILPCKSNRKKNELRNNEANSWTISWWWISCVGKRNWEIKGWNLPKEKGRPKVLLSLSFLFKNVGRYLLGNMLCVMRRQAFKVDFGTHSHPKEGTT